MISILALASTLAVGLAAAVPAPDYVSPVTVLRPQNATMEQFEHDFRDLCPQYYGESEVTDQPVYIDTTFEVSLDQGNDQWSGRRADVSCVYQTSRTEYINIGIDVAEALGGDTLVTISPIEMGSVDPVRA
ncbi:hypothetical protein IAT40_001519 [Kwoniella sp. CBS 6097]